MNTTFGIQNYWITSHPGRITESPQTVRVTGFTFSQSELLNQTFTHLKLLNSTFTHLKLLNSSFSQSKLLNSCFSQSELLNPHFSQSEVQNLCVRQSKLLNSRFSQSNYWIHLLANQNYWIHLSANQNYCFHLSANRNYWFCNSANQNLIWIKIHVEFKEIINPILSVFYVSILFHWQYHQQRSPPQTKTEGTSGYLYHCATNKRTLSLSVCRHFIPISFFTDGENFMSAKP